MEFVYRDWSLPYGRPKGESYEEAVARQRFDSGQSFGLVVGDPDAPSLVAAIHRQGRVIHVTWLDDLLRQEFAYVFTVREDQPSWPQDLVLLEQSHLYVYDDDRRPPKHEHSWIESYHFHPDGRIYGSRGPVVGDREVMQTTLPVDQLQTERVPAFGEWEPFLRRER